MPSAPKALNTILYGPPGTGKTYATARRCVEICDGPLDEPVDQGEIQRRYRALVEDERVEFITFHQSYGYEEFVEGLRPETGSDASFCLVPKPGVLKRIAERAGEAARFSLDGRQIFGMWLKEPGNNKEDLFKPCIEKNLVLLGKVGNVDWSDAKYDDLNEIKRKVESENGRTLDPSFINSIRNKMQMGDIVIVPRDSNKFGAIGEIEGPYQYLPNEPFPHGRKIKWHWHDSDGKPLQNIGLEKNHQHTIHPLDKVDREKLLEYIIKPYVLVIDEINRANISKVMGELITLLEEDKRAGAENEVSVTLPYSDDPFKLPANLHILGTMNTADRSIALIDTALRRRFQFEELPPDPRRLKEVDGIKLPEVLRAINDRLEYLIDRDHLIGHAWLMQAKTKTDVDRIMQHKIIPLIAEYFYDDWRKVKAVLGGGDDFVQSKKLQKPPGLEDADADEDRHRWTLNEEPFPPKAYRHLIEGKRSGGGGAD